MRKVSAEQETDMIEEELGDAFWRFKQRHDHQGHPVQYLIDTAMCARERVDPTGFRIIGERVKECAGHVIVDPIDRAAVWIAPNWPAPVVSTSRNTIARVRLGSIILRRPTHFPAMLKSNCVNPVTLPPGRARLLT